MSVWLLIFYMRFVFTFSKPHYARVSSPPVFLTGASPLGPVNQLGDAGDHARSCGRYITQGCIGAELPSTCHPTTVGCVPGVVAVGPRKQISHGHEEVVECDADHHIVVDANIGGHHHHAIAYSCKGMTLREKQADTAAKCHTVSTYPKNHKVVGYKAALKGGLTFEHWADLPDP